MKKTVKLCRLLFVGGFVFLVKATAHYHLSEMFGKGVKAIRVQVERGA